MPISFGRLGRPFRSSNVRGVPELRPSAPIDRRLTLIFAAACGLAVANLYYAQPLLDAIARSLRVSHGQAGLIVTFSQLGYAAGLVLLVPLGDLLNRRRLVVAALAVTALGLVAVAAAPSLTAFAIAIAVVGATSVVAQMLVALAAVLAAPPQRGKVVGTVMTGLLIGILVARTASGLIAAAAGWRAVYGLAAVLMVALAVVLWRAVPHVRSEVDLGYRALLRSIGRIAREEGLVRRRALYGAIGFACFSAFWTSVAFLLAGPPFRYGEGVIGLFGLLGVAGALMASLAGRLADAGRARPARGLLLVAMAASFGLLAWGGHRLLALIAGVLVLDLAVQGVHILNQSDIYTIRPESRGRITAVYMTCYFAGGAVGSALSAALYGSGGWDAVCVLGGALAAVGIAFWLVEGRLEAHGRVAAPASAG